MEEFREREAQHYLIGRLILDGAEPTALAERFNLAVCAIDDSWAIAQEQLSLEWSTQQRQPYRLLTIEELRLNIAFCLRCLLRWREQLQRSLDVGKNGLLLQEGVRRAARALETLGRGDLPDNQDIVVGVWALDALHSGANKSVSTEDLASAAVWLRTWATSNVGDVSSEARELALQWMALVKGLDGELAKV